MVCGNFILPEPASYVFFYTIFNLRNLLYIIHSARVVIADEILNHIDQSFLAVEPLAVVAFPLEDTPEALHGAIVNAMRNTGHTLRHTVWVGRR